MNVKDFEERFMQLVNGQMPLPQHVFRQFLGWLKDQSASDASMKQDKTDNSLETTDKTVVGAINEVNSALMAEISERKDNMVAVDETTGKLVIKVGDDMYQLEGTLIEG